MAKEVELMKERFAKLLLGEDMSGGGKGVCTALAISNAITNLAATVFPALKKLDAMLLSMLEGFKETEFWYADRESDDQDPLCLRTENGKDCLGEIIYRYITAELFTPECLLDCLDLSSEHQILEIANRIEASVHVWRLKDQKRLAGHSRSKRASWGGKVKGLVSDNDKNQLLARRAETLLRFLKLRFPVLPQTALDMSKIQYNQDVGQAILESYSRVTESLAFNIMARIDDLLFVDDAAKQSASESKSHFCRGGFGGLPLQKRMSPSPFSIQHSPYASPFATPSFCLTPASGSPGRSLSTLSKMNLKASEDLKTEKTLADEFEKIWAHPGNLSARKASGDAPERD